MTRKTNFKNLNETSRGHTFTPHFFFNLSGFKDNRCITHAEKTVSNNIFVRGRREKRVEK